MANTDEKDKKRRSFGCVRKLPSENYRADYLGPDRRRHHGPFTFQVKRHAENWLDAEKKLIEKGKWTPPAERARKAELKRERKSERASITLSEYGLAWIERHDLADSTRGLWERQLEAYVYKRLGGVALRDIRTPAIREWHVWAKRNVAQRPREGAYTALRIMMSVAVEDGLIKKNPCTLKNVTQRGANRTGKTLTPEQVKTIALAMGSPADKTAIRAHVRSEVAKERALIARDRSLDDKERRSRIAKVRKGAKRTAMVEFGIDQPQWIALVMLGCYGALRTGELQALRRRDVSLADGTVDIQFAARYLRPRKNALSTESQEAGESRLGRWVGDAPVKAEGERQIPIVPHLIELLQQHLDTYVEPEPDALLFPPPSWSKLTEEKKAAATPAQRNQRLASSTFFDYWKAAVKRAGLTDVHFHDLRHTGGSLYTQAGATIKEVMEFMGHRSPATAYLYQHGNADRHRTIAARVSRLADEFDQLAA
ncbi:site-specific integrase [Demequina sp. NBRC 110051]|uniref:tyrosine-type recombinase/integrase n=1 Tax=Demequina sp. NBRC 110051 TaxID=1570340 RepID=UPI000A03C956|nr:site-specific integrase [Demequina sp. NBRC 110051]